MPIEEENGKETLKGFQRKYLRGLAHSLRPIVFVGRKGLTETLVKSADHALADHELIKVKFNDFKEKEQKQEIIEALAGKTASECVGMIGHVAILYRMQKDPEKRGIRLPER